jgi:hypothetical protein
MKGNYMSKYAITIGSSHAYMQGLNATLNALDYYGVKDIDVYVFSNKFLKEYFDYLEGKFNFPLYYLDAEELCPVEETHFADDGDVAWKDVMFFWGKYPLFNKIKDKYDAILHLDGDMMVVDDISSYFKTTAETGNLLIAGNDRSVYSLSQIEDSKLISSLSISHWNKTNNTMLEFCMGFPVLNYVFFFDAKKYDKLINYVWKCRNNHIENTKHFGLETAYFIQGLYECNLLNKVVPLSFKHWIADDYLGKTDILLKKDINGKFHLIAPDGKNIQVTHGRFWNSYNTEHTIELTNPIKYAAEYSRLLYNFESYTRLTDFLNYDWKAKLNEVLSLNPSYGSFLNKDRAWDRVLKWLETPWPHGEDK